MPFCRGECQDCSPHCLCESEQSVCDTCSVQGYCAWSSLQVPVVPNSSKNLFCYLFLSQLLVLGQVDKVLEEVDWLIKKLTSLGSDISGNESGPILTITPLSKTDKDRKQKDI